MYLAAFMRCNVILPAPCRSLARFLTFLPERIFTYKTFYMLRWTVTFLIIAIVAAIFGFTGIAAGAATIAKIIFFIFIVLFLLSLIGGRSRV
jgi:uncharacterized membrane protein YtjA (UPF0391 family)